MTAAAGEGERADLARRATLLTVALLCATFAGWQASRQPIGTAAVMTALALGVWAVAWPGLWQGRRRTYAWSTLLLAPFVTYGLMEAIANPGARVPAALTLLASLAVFASQIAYLRTSRPVTGR